MSRIILHCDMNNFYASVECAMDPSLRGRAVAVCGDVADRHGIVLAKNYIAKRFGIRTAETVYSAIKKCPSLVTVPPHFEEYMKYSRMAREIYSGYTSRVEPFGLDECWLDISAAAVDEEHGVCIANEIKGRIKKELGVTLSVGVSFNKVFAKLGSDMKKPDAVTLIPHDGFLDFIGGIPVSDMLGVGGNTAEKLSKYGVHSIAQLAAFPRAVIVNMLGKCGDDIWHSASGLDSSPVASVTTDIIDKSAGNGITAQSDLEDNEEVWGVILELSDELSHRLEKSGKRASAVSIVIKDNTLAVKQWQRPLECSTKSGFAIARQAFSLFCDSYTWSKPVRAVTVRVINLETDCEPSQINLFVTPEKRENRKNETLVGALEGIRDRFGMSAVKNARVLNNNKMPGLNIPNTLPRGVRG